MPRSNIQAAIIRPMTSVIDASAKEDAVEYAHVPPPQRGGNWLERSDPCEKKGKIIFTTRSYLSRTRCNLGEREKKRECVYV